MNETHRCNFTITGLMFGSTHEISSYPLGLFVSNHGAFEATASGLSAYLHIVVIGPAALETSISSGRLSDHSITGDVGLDRKVNVRRPEYTSPRAVISTEESFRRPTG